MSKPNEDLNLDEISDRNPLVDIEQLKKLVESDFAELEIGDVGMVNFSITVPYASSPTKSNENLDKLW